MNPAYEVSVVSDKTNKTIEKRGYWTLDMAELEFEKLKKGYPRAFIVLKHYRGKVIKAFYGK